MADYQGDRNSPKRQHSNQGMSQTFTPETGQYGDISSNGSSNQQNTQFSHAQEPVSVLWYWMFVQYYQQYYYQLCSYMYYWQSFASNSMYQRAFQAQTSLSHSGLRSQGLQAAFTGHQAQQNIANALNNQRPPPNNAYGVGLLPGQAVPWAFPGQQAVTTVCEVQIAPISKRVYAEILDFIFLYLTKVLVFSIFYDDLERYNQLQYTLITDDTASLKDIEELLIQALVYRLMVFAYEVFFLMGGLHGSVGGATPGKYLMGLSVVATYHITTVATSPDGERVRIVPGGNLGFWRSFIRALVKNFSMTFLFPVFLTILFFQHNRTIYDVIANSTVVITGVTRARQQGNQHRRQ